MSAIDPWKTMPPAYGPHLPGGIVPLTLRDARRKTLLQIPWRSIRHLHAALTTTIGRAHHTTQPDFSLIPTPLAPSGWALYLKDLAVAQTLVGASADARLGEAPVTIACGHLVKLRTPSVERAGRQRVCMTAETPVVIRHASAGSTDHGNAKQVYPSPVEYALISSLTHALAERLGLDVAPADVALRILATDTQTENVIIGHLNGQGIVRGWTGRVVMDVSPLGRWLLDCAERLGLGGRTAFGFGRVRVGTMALDAPLLGEPYPPEGRDEDRVSAQAIHAWTKLHDAPLSCAVAGVEAMRTEARFERIADNGTWTWKHGNVLLFVEPDALGRQRVCALGAVEGSEEALRLAGETGAPDETRGGVPCFILTPHAIARYQARIEPHLSYDAAKVKLQALTEAGRRVRVYAAREDKPEAELWRGPKTGRGTNTVQPADSRIRFLVVKGDRGRPTVSTVLPHGNESGRG